MAEQNPYSWIDKSLSALRRVHRYRAVQTVEGMSGPVVELRGKRLINFASNDYLGFASHPKLIQAAVEATQRYGTGSTGSRLLSGHRELHRALEEAIATLKQTEDAIVFSSGYLANIGTIAALVGAPDLILSDEYNHSSLINGARMSGATMQYYRHSDIRQLEKRLTVERPDHRRCLILTDSVFSMDGDLCPLPDILSLGNAHDAMVLVDEAHGTGVLGQSGAGCVEHYGCTGQLLIQMGTLSKALGSLGGYVASSATLVDFLRNRAPGWIYTTGLSPADTAAALAAVRLLQQEPAHRHRLWDNVTYLTQRLDEIFPVEGQDNGQIQRLPSKSPIICLKFPSAAAVIETGRVLQQQGLWVAAVRPPTVPTSRLRITVMATHQKAHLDQLIGALSNIQPKSPKAR
jgi:8-amino-7-oxononanoate synthase